MKYIYYFLCLALWSASLPFTAARTVTNENGKNYFVDPKTHQVFSGTIENGKIALGQFVGSGEFAHWVPIAPPPPMTQPPKPAPNLGLPVDTKNPQTDTFLPSIPPSCGKDYAPSMLITAGQAAQITQAVNELFGPGIPVTDYTAMNQAAEQNAALAQRANAEADRIKNTPIAPHTFPLFQPTEEQIRLHQQESILDVSSIPDPAEATLPYQFQSSGESREQLVNLYKHLYKIQPQTGKRKTARELGLAAVEEADTSYAQGNPQEGHFYSELAEGFLDLAIGLDPATGMARSTFELIIGRNFVTGQKLSNWEYGFAALNIVTLGSEGSIAAGLKGLSKIVQRGTKFVRTVELTTEGIRVAERVIETTVSQFGSNEAVSNFFKIVGNDIGSIGPNISETIKTIKVPSIWTETKYFTSVKNAFKHWKEHRNDFSHINNAIEYVEEANNFIKNPPPGTLIKTRIRDGSRIMYHPESNIFAIMDQSGAPEQCINQTQPTTAKLQTWSISMPNNKLTTCKVCGFYYKDYYPWGEFGDCPTFDFCVCCGTEFGYQDATPAAAKKKRDEWIHAGAKWNSPEHQPNNWNLQQQLENIPNEYK